MIDHSTIERILDAAQITEVVQEFVPLRKRGVNLLGLCPFHNEKTPSFTVSPAKGIFKCFGCGKGGNSVNFIMEHEHLTYPEALKYLARKYNIEVEEREASPEDIEKQNERESMLVLSAYAGRQFSENLFNSDEGISVGLSYFKERGFRHDTLKKFDLGYCFEKRDAFTRKALDDGYMEEYLVKTGLSIKNEDRIFDRFAGRVMFPIHSLSGQILGFGGRILRKDAKTAKYLNSPESEIYHKSKIVYGIYHARKAITHDDKCFLVEGYTDVLSLHEAGIENVVASSGTSLTQEQIKLIKRFTPNITILYDGDAAGIKASLRGIDLVLEEGMNVKIVLLPDGEDPDSYSKKVSTEEFRSFIRDNETDFIRFKTRLLLDEVKNDPLKRAELIRDLVKSIAVIPEAITRMVYIKECSSLMEVNETLLTNEVTKLLRQKSFQDRNRYPGVQDLPTVTTSHQVIEQAVPKRPPAEGDLVRFLLRYGDTVLFREENKKEGTETSTTVSEYIVKEITGDDLHFSDKILSEIFGEYTYFVTQGLFPGDQHFVKHPNPEISSISASFLTDNYELSRLFAKKKTYVETERDKLADLIPQTVLVFKKEKIKVLYKELTAELAEASSKNDIEKVNGLIRRKITLDTIMGIISKKLNDRITS